MKKVILSAIALAIICADILGQESIESESGGGMVFLNRVVNFVMDDRIPLGNPETNRFDFGRIQTIPTYNPMEGVRLRAGVASNSRLSPHFFVKGYAAYGFSDKKFKYRGEATWSFDRKDYHDNEFPKNNLNLIYENDIYSPGELHPRSPNDLLLITYRRSVNEATYRNFAELNWEREYLGGFAHTAWVRKSRMIPQGDLLFESRFDNDLLTEDELNISEAGVQFRYSLREDYIQQRRKRVSTEMTAPVFFLSHTYGQYEYFGEKRDWHRSEFSVQKRFVLGRVGRLDVVGDVMKVWSRVPFPMLVYPNQRYRHHIENSAFFLTRALEFVADEQYTLRAAFVGDDLLLSKIEFLNFLQPRELLSLRLSYGRLSDKNNPMDSDVYNFPEVSHEYGNLPYIEGIIGITNILGLLRVEYVHRFTYRDHPNALLGRVRVDITL